MKRFELMPSTSKHIRRPKARKSEIELTIDSRCMSAARGASNVTIESRRVSVAATVETDADTQNVYEVVCCKHCKEFETKLNNIESWVKDLKQLIEDQNKVILDAISGQKVATETLVRQESESAPISKYFPLNNTTELRELESKICAANRDIFESVISNKICSNIKNIALVMSAQLINDINVDGNHGKVGLKSFPNIFDLLTGALSKLPYKGKTPEDMLRMALQIQKSKMYKKVYREKKKCT